MPIAHKSLASLIPQGRPFVVGRCIGIKEDVLLVAAKDKDKNPIPGAPKQQMPRRVSTIVAGSLVLAVTEWGKKIDLNAAAPAWAPLEFKPDDVVCVLLESMRRDGVGFDCQGTIQLVTEVPVK